MNEMTAQQRGSSDDFELLYRELLETNSDKKFHSNENSNQTGISSPAEIKIREDQPNVEVHSNTDSNHSNEVLKQKLFESEEANRKLRSNLQKLKSKLIDTNALITLFNKTKENLKAAMQQVEVQKQESLTLKVQLEKTLQDEIPMKQQIDLLKQQIIDLETDVKNKEHQVHAAKAFNIQLKAELDSLRSIKEENDKFNKEIAKLKKDLQLKDEEMRQLFHEHDAKNSQLQSQLKEIQKLQSESREKNGERKISTLHEQSPSMMSVSMASNVNIIGQKRKSTQANSIRKKQTAETTNTISIQPLNIQIHVDARKPSESEQQYLFRKLKELSETTFEQSVSDLSKETNISEKSLIDGIPKYFLQVPPQSSSSSPEYHTDPQIDIDMLICLVYHLKSTKSKNFQNLLELAFMDLVTANQCSLNVSQLALQSVCVCITRMCFLEGNLLIPRILCFDLLTQRKFEIDLIYAVVNTWPLVLQYKPKEDCLLLKTVEIVIGYGFSRLYKLHNKKTELQKEVKYYEEIKSISKWNSIVSEPSIEELVNELLEALVLFSQSFEENRDSIFNVQKALELVSVAQGWVWTYNVLIVGKLFSLLNANQQNDKLLASLIRLIGMLGKLSFNEKSEDHNNSASDSDEALNQLRQRIERTLEYYQNAALSFECQVSGAEALIDMSGGIVTNLQCIVSWHKKLSSVQQSNLPSQLDRIIQLFYT